MLAATVGGMAGSVTIMPPAIQPNSAAPSKAVDAVAAVFEAVVYDADALFNVVVAADAVDDAVESAVANEAEVVKSAVSAADKVALAPALPAETFVRVEALVLAVVEKFDDRRGRGRSHFDKVEAPLLRQCRHRTGAVSGGARTAGQCRHPVP